LRTEQLQTLTDTFEGHAQQTDSGVEFWLARGIQHLLGYAEWRNFGLVIRKAKTACEVSAHATDDHFVDVNKTIAMPKGATKEVADIMLTRYACYLIAINGDPRKSEIAFAQTYFAIQTRKAEIIEQHMLAAERIHARKKLTVTEKELSQVIFERTGGNQDFALIRSKGDHALFGKSTQAMKAEWKVPDSRPLADFAPTILLKAKDFAAEITIFNAQQHNMAHEAQISKEHITNNQAVRNTLLERGVRPESLLPEKDVKKWNDACKPRKEKRSTNPINWVALQLLFVARSLSCRRWDSPLICGRHKA